MDVDDVSNVDQYTRYLNSQKLTFKAAAARDGEVPTDRKSRNELVHRQQMIVLQAMFQKLEPQETQIHSSFLPPPYPPSTASVGNLAPIYIKEIRLGTHHRGRYLLVRAASAPSRMTAVMAVVEDEKCDAILIQIFQQPEESIRPISNIIAEGNIFLIKEPFFKIMADGGYGLRVDHVSDIIRIDSLHSLCPETWKANNTKIRRTADDWKREGNAAMEKKEYWNAIQSYTNGLASHPSPPEKTTIQLNRALAYLQDESYEEALADTQCLGSTPATSEKSLYRAGKALYGLQRFAECRKILEILCQKYPTNLEAAKDLKRALLRLAEQQSGSYDFKYMYKEVSVARPPHLDHATFIGPVKVKISQDRGQELFTTKAVKAGELLLCEKAFAHCYAGTPDESPGSSAKLSLLINIHTNRMTMGTQGDLITKIVQKLTRNPSLLTEFVTLHHGSYESVNMTEVDGKPIIDTFLVERIIALNCFGCGLTITLAEASSATSRSFVRPEIFPDTELVFWYKAPTGDHLEMKKGLKQWGFECKCAMCIDSQNTPKKLLRKRNYLLENLKATFNEVNVNVVKAERILNAIGQTYKHPASEVPRLILPGSYVKLASIYSEKQNVRGVLETSLKALESLGFVIKGAQLPVSPSERFHVEKWGIVTDDVVNLWVFLWNAYAALAPSLLEPVAACGNLAYKICVGEDVTFEESYGDNRMSGRTV